MSAPQPSGPELDTAGIVSTVLEGVLYGFSVLMYMLTVYIICRRRRPSEWNWINLTIANLLFALSTAHVGIDIYRIWLGLIAHRETPGGPIAYFSDVSQGTFVSKSAVYSFQTAIGDGTLIYRAWMVWTPTRWPLILPIMLWFSLAAASIGTVYTISLANADSGNIFAVRTGQWITSFYSTTLACNLVATLVLVWRLWAIEKQVKGVRTSGSALKPILHIVVDSGALYSATLIVALTCFASGSRAQYIVLDMVMPIISISFYMVLLRISFVRDGRSTGLTIGTVGTGNLTGGGHGNSSSGGAYGTHTIGSARLPRRQQVEVQIDTMMHTDTKADPDMYPIH